MKKAAAASCGLEPLSSFVLSPSQKTSTHKKLNSLEFFLLPCLFTKL